MSKKILVPLLLILMAPASFALNLQGHRFSDSYRYGLLDDGLAETFEGKNVFTASYAYLHSPLYFSDTYLHEIDKEIIDENQVLTVGYTRYLNRNVSLGLDLHGVHNTVFNDTHTTLGDTTVKARLNLLRKNGFSLSANPQVFLPTGKTENFSGAGSLGGALSFVAEKSFDRLHFLASLGGLSSKDNAYLDVDHRQLLLSQLGISVDLTERLNINLEAWRNFPLVDDVYQDEGKYFATFKHKTFPRASVYGGAGVTGPTDVSSHSYSAFIGIKLHERAEEIQEEVAMTAAAPRRSFDEIYFGHDRDYLEGEEIEKFSREKEKLQGLGPHERIRLDGHASAVGPFSYNMKLSQRRANRIKDALLEFGIPAEQIEVHWFGETAPQHPVEGRNRRVHMEVISSKEHL